MGLTTVWSLSPDVQLVFILFRQILISYSEAETSGKCFCLVTARCFNLPVFSAKEMKYL